MIRKTMIEKPISFFPLFSLNSYLLTLQAAVVLQRHLGRGVSSQDYVAETGEEECC